MCICGPPSPVFLVHPHGPRRLFLDSFFGSTLADGLRAIVGYPPLNVRPDTDIGARIPHGLPRAAPIDGPYGFVCSCGGDSFLATTFSSLWALGIFVLALAAGFTFASSRERALWMVGIGAAVSLADTGVRMGQRWDRAPGYSDMMLAGLPLQLVSNFLFQLALPFAFALLLVRLVNATAPSQPAAR